MIVVVCLCIIGLILTFRDEDVGVPGYGWCGGGVDLVGPCFHCSCFLRESK